MTPPPGEDRDTRRARMWVAAVGLALIALVVALDRRDPATLGTLVTLVGMGIVRPPWQK